MHTDFQISLHEEDACVIRLPDIVMKTSHITRSCGLLCAAILSSCAPPADTSQTQVSSGANAQSSPSRNGDKSIKSEIFNQVNAYRRSKGVKDVQRHAGLDRLAQEHCEYLRQNRGSFSIYGKNVSHYGFEGRAVAAREHYQMPNSSENVAAAYNPGSNAAPAVIALWKESNDHHKNMLDTWSHGGVGVVVDSDGTVFATQMFGAASNSQMRLRDKMNSY